MLEFLKKGENKFSPGDIAFTKKDMEKVLILKITEPTDTRNKDLGTCYLLRGDDNKFKVLFEFELMTLDEATEKTNITATY